MKYLLLFLTLITFNCTAQDYKAMLATHRQQYKADFISDKHSPLKEADLQNLHFFDADSTYRVNAEVELLTNQDVFSMPTFNGAQQAYVKYAVVKFMLKGKAQQLNIYQNVSLSKRPEFAGYLFLPFLDKTNSEESYGGGRYIDLKTTDIKNGYIELDFNKAYNPYCAYSDGYQCPMPPRENYLDLKVKAGEKQYTGEKKHL
ncbi:DUF1684 domain-containing protein [Mucilaginibacter sp. 14171R-50]|uniref:DUF1684 domain-containing protein n=1 Tax=Mucilaginibacter sp. 14171R-50 TaxID=2703789 RepID=UPI00138D3F2D|nr:DUF1684 domain-containing protein [Mucilaginibacter sp. 14171R-50]QHS55797.1 DUF1684 domain-containing protein [Mucilaginibacter sp. 14171R-50]